MVNKLRLRIFEKLAQANPPENLPTTQTAQTKTVSGSPPSFMATDYYPITLAFSPRNTPIINVLSNLLNQALYYSSDGKIHLPWMRSVNFNFDTSNIPSVDLKNLMEFSKQIYNQIYTSNGKFDNRQLTAQEIFNRINPLKYSQYINNLSSTNPAGQLASKIGGNIKNFINNYLLQIK